MISLGVRPNVATYSSRIGSCETVEEAVSIFEEMEEAQISPDGATYCVLIDVCRRCGDEDKANELSGELTLVSALDAAEKSDNKASQNQNNPFNFLNGNNSFSSPQTKSSKWDLSRQSIISLPRPCTAAGETVTPAPRKEMRVNAEPFVSAQQQAQQV